MLKLSSVLGLFKVDATNPGLVKAQMLAFSKQIPMLYLLLIANTAFVSATHVSAAPLWLSLWLPIGFICVALMRLVSWWRMRKAELSVTESVRRLRTTIMLTTVFGTAVTSWSFALYPYGDSLARTHVIFFMAITMIGCVFCLMHLRAAAFSLALVVSIPFIVFFCTSDHPVLLAIAANLVLVTVVMLIILSNHYRDFITMVNQRLHLENVNVETQRLSDANRKLAHMDSLTGLPNRRSFIAEVESRVARSDAKFALGIVDLDGFKAVNDLYGHATGDALLIEASRRMEQFAGDDVVFARLGGDEFGIILDGNHDPLSFGRSICEILRQPYELDDVVAEVTSSCGMAEFPATCRSTTELFEHADYALYQVKERSGGNTIVFSASHRDALRRVHEIDQALRNCDLTAELTLVYQPVYDLQTKSIVSFEALARWRSETLGDISPLQFISVAEKSSLVNRLTLVLFDKLLDDCSKWPDDIKVAFNLSARTLAAPDAMLQLMNRIRSSGVDAHRLEFEVTETALMIDFETTRKALQLLRNLGARVALDDFGTGYSSLSYVHQLPLDKIKIDRKFIANATHSRKASSVVETIVDLCENLKLDCVAEGVETPQQAKAAQKLGCHMAQGFLFGKPVPSRDVTALLANQRPTAVRTA